MFLVARRRGGVKTSWARRDSAKLVKARLELDDEAEPMSEPAVDLLLQAVSLTRPQLERSKQLKERVEIYWAAIASATDLAASNVVRNEFLRLADESGLATDLRRDADLYNSDSARARRSLGLAPPQSFPVK